MQPPQNYVRYCPGEEQILISDAVCFGRRRVHFPKCRGCRFNDDEREALQSRRVIAPGFLVQQAAQDMTDSVFKAYDIRGIYPQPLNEDLAWRIGFGVGTFLKTILRGMERSDAQSNRIAVGQDMRQSSPALCSALINGIQSSGAGVISIGMIDTSQLYFAVNHLRCCGGVQTTASHNPAPYNGFKICGPGGRPIGEDTGLHEIRAIAKNTASRDMHQRAVVETIDLSDVYRKFILRYLDRPRSLRIVIDASNGMAGRWIPRIFSGVDELHIDPLHFEHDGHFVHDPNPLVAQNVRQLQDRVCATGADLGVCFDGDADRCVLVDETGQIVSCDLLTALLARYFLESRPGSAIVYDLRSSRVVAEGVEQGGGVPLRCRVGHAFMKKMMAESQAVFGGELSGHFYFQDNWYCDSGLLAFVHVVNVLSRTNRSLSALIAPFQKYCSSGERNFINDDPKTAIINLGRQYQDAQIDHLDGLTLSYPDWWCNVRKSNTEPLLRLNLEANDPELLARKLGEVSQYLGRPVEH